MIVFPRIDFQLWEAFNQPRLHNSGMSVHISMKNDELRTTSFGEPKELPTYPYAQQISGIYY